MDNAKQLLMETKDYIWQIAYELGYSKPSSFGHEFRKTTAVVPLKSSGIKKALQLVEGPNQNKLLM